MELAAPASQTATNPPQSDRIARVPVHPLSRRQAMDVVIARALSGEPGATVVLTNANIAYEASRSEALRAAVDEAFLSFPDGMPMVWILRRRGHRHTEKVTGREFMPMVVREGVSHGIRHLLYGGAPGVSQRASELLTRQAPQAHVRSAPAPPFASIEDWPIDDLESLVSKVRPHILWVGLGAPKQEILMAKMARRLDVPVLIGVGAAFDFIAGTKSQVPRAMSDLGLEWLFRLTTEPRRLWKRYLLGNAKFVYLLGLDALPGRGAGRMRKSNNSSREG